MRALQAVLNTVKSFPGISNSFSGNGRMQQRNGIISFFADKKTSNGEKHQLPDNLQLKTNEAMKDQKTVFDEAKEVEGQKAKAALERILAAEKEKNEKLCAIWEAKLKALPWFDGHSHNIPGLLQQNQHFLNAKLLMTEFESIYFPVRICNTLERLARDLQTRIILFPINSSKTAKILAGEVTRSIEERIEFLKQNKDWLNGPNQKPMIIDKDDLFEFSRKTDELREFLAEDHAQFDLLLKAFNQLKELMTICGSTK